MHILVTPFYFIGIVFVLNQDDLRPSEGRTLPEEFFLIFKA